MYHSLHLTCHQLEKDSVEADLYELGTTGITEQDRPGDVCELQAFFTEPFDENPVFANYQPHWSQHLEEEWVDTFEPFPVGQRLYVVPAWRDDPAPPGRLRLAIHARQASGSGYQPATQLALEALENYLQKGDRFLDVGTGSGILSVAAELLGAGPRFACDIDLEALAEASENRTPAHLFAGSPRSIASASMDLVAANLNAEALLNLQTDLLRVLKPEGRLILSGFTQRNVDRLAQSFANEVIESLESGNWRALILAKR